MLISINSKTVMVSRYYIRLTSEIPFNCKRGNTLRHLCKNIMHSLDHSIISTSGLEHSNTLRNEANVPKTTNSFVRLFLLTVVNIVQI